MLKNVGWVKATQRKTSSQHFCCTRSEDWVNIICLGSWKQNQQSLVSESYYKVQRVVLTTRSLWLAMVFVCTETLHPGSKDTTMRGFYCWLWRCLIKQIHIIITQIGPLLVRIKFVFLDSNLYWSNKNCVMTYRILTVFEDPDPFCHPVMTTTLSPVPMKLLRLPKSMAYWTRSSTSFIQSASRSFSYSNGMHPLKICICRATWPYLCIGYHHWRSFWRKKKTYLHIPCNRENGTVRLVLWHDVRGGSRGGEHNNGSSLTLVGGQHCADGSRGCVVKACRLLLALLYKTKIM